jgi:hypothetical protein
MLNLFNERFSPEIDINAYLWSFDSSQLNAFNAFGSTTKPSFDFFSNSTAKSLKSANSLYTNKQSGGSSINTNVVTPSVQKLCKCLDEDLNKLLNDIDFTTNVNSTSNNNYETSLKLTSIVNDDLKCFNEYLNEYLQIFTESLCESIHKTIESLRESSSSIENKDFEFKEKNINKIVFICRFVHALPNYCLSLKYCFSSLIQHRQIQKLTPTIEVNLSAKKPTLSEQRVI